MIWWAQNQATHCPLHLKLVHWVITLLRRSTTVTNMVISLEIKRNEWVNESQSAWSVWKPQLVMGSWSWSCPWHMMGQLILKPFIAFVTKGTAFVGAGGVQTKEQVFILSHYLSGKAHEFDICEVSSNLYKWRLYDFFLKLFNNYFPIDFRTKQREKLKWTYQNEQSIHDYISKLNELCNLIEGVSKCDQVMKLWLGFNNYIQTKLWKDKLNPKESTLKQMIAAAKVIEIAYSMGTQKERAPPKEIKCHIHAQSSIPVCLCSWPSPDPNQESPSNFISDLSCSLYRTFVLTASFLSFALSPFS